jgi:CRP-like cAMP-binding protein
VKLRYVGNAPFFSALSEEEQERISQRMHLEHRRSGELLFRRGDDSAALYLIKAGWVRLLANGGTALASQGPGSLVGETDLFLDRPRSIGAGIASDAELWVLTKKDLIDLIAESPSIGLKLTMAFGSRLALFDHYLVEHRLNTLPFLSGLEEESLAGFARRLIPMEKMQGEYIVEGGQPPEALFIIESGQVHLHTTEEGGDFSELGEGETFGEMAMLTGKPHARSAQASTDAIIWALPSADFEDLTSERPEIRLALSKAMREPLMHQDMNRAVERLSTMPLFAGLSEEILWAIAQRMLLNHIPAGEMIFVEGSPGNAFYLIDTGVVEIVSDVETGRAVLARLGADEFFGETALLTGKPRSSASRAATHTNLWVLYRSDFDDLVNRYPSISVALSKVLSQRLTEMDQRFTESHLRNLKLLADLSSSQLEDVSGRLHPARYRQGEEIIREGEPGDEMYFIESGRVQVVRGDGDGAMLLAEMAAGDLFGEMALLTGNPRSASVVALSNLDVWVLSQADFEELVGAYPNLALALSRLLSERLRNTDQRFLKQPVTAPAPKKPRPKPAPAPAPTRAAQPRPAPRPAPRRRPVRRQPARSLMTEISDSFKGLALWYGSLSTWGKFRLIAITMLIVWMLCIMAPALVISTLAADNVTNLEGAIAFVQTATPPVTDTPQATPAPIIVYQTVIPPTDTPLPATQTAMPPTETPLPPTQTPWIIIVTATPMPATDTPIPPTPTEPPTATPVPPKAASAPPKPTPTAVPAVSQQPPRQLDPRLPSLGVVVEPVGVKPGQFYWRLVEARWQNEAEAGGDHTIYVELKDEHGNRVVGHPVEIRWVGGSLNVVTEDKPPPVYASNFPMYNTLGSYAVKIPGLPSDTIVGLGLGTAEQPAFTVHTNFFLTFKKVKR